MKESDLSETSPSEEYIYITLPRIKTRAFMTALPTTVCAFSQPRDIHKEVMIADGRKASAKSICTGDTPSTRQTEATKAVASAVKTIDRVLPLLEITANAHAKRAVLAEKVSTYKVMGL